MSFWDILWAIFRVSLVLWALIALPGYIRDMRRNRTFAKMMIAGMTAGLLLAMLSEWEQPMSVKYAVGATGICALVAFVLLPWRPQDWKD